MFETPHCPQQANFDKETIVPGCSGLMAWRPGQLAEYLLTRWWNTDDFNSTYFAKPFEQPGMTEGLLMDPELRVRMLFSPPPPHPTQHL